MTEVPIKALPDWREACRVWLKIGCLGLGGPLVQIALLHRILVQDKRWLREEQFVRALNFCMMLPGPEAQQLATYSGWLLHGWRGALAAGLLFLLPGFIGIGMLAMAYVTLGQVTELAEILYGVKAAMIALVAEALLRIGRRTLISPVPGVLAVLVFAGISWLHLPYPILVVGTGCIMAMSGRITRRTPPEVTARNRSSDPECTQNALRSFLRTAGIWVVIWLLPIAACFWLTGPNSLWTEMGIFFGHVAIVTFGGAYAVLAYVSQQVVMEREWLNAAQMLDGLAVAGILPGPLIQVTQWVGFLAAASHEAGMDAVVAGWLAASLVAWVVYAPSFLWICALAPLDERWSGNARWELFLQGVSAAVMGAMASFALWFFYHVLFPEQTEVGWRVEQMGALSPDMLAMGIALMAGGMVFVYRWGVMRVLALGMGLGLAGQWVIRW